MRAITAFSILALWAAPVLAQDEPDSYDDAEPYDSAQQPMNPYGDQPGEQAAEDDDLDDSSYDDGYDPNAYTQFQDTLSPYGSWYDDSTYGHVWYPSTTIVGVGFAPYATGGHWVLTEYGWTWVSDWDWGWAPFHYGRWVVASRGWCWVPGTIWGPGWVRWRAGGGYVGWRPLGPTRFRTYDHRYNHRSGWRFTTTAQLGSPRMRYLSSRSIGSAYPRTRVIRHDRSLTSSHGAWRYNAGPRFAPRDGAMRRPVGMAQVAPRAMPRYVVTPRVNAPQGQRNYDWRGGTQRPRVERARPEYRQPQPSAPVYRQPQRQPSAPMYRQPQPSAPVYRAPQRSYQPAAPSAPAYRAPPARSYSPSHGEGRRYDHRR